MTPDKNHSWKPYIPFVVAGFLVFLAYELYPFIDGLLGAIILYVLLRPLMRHLVERRHWRKGLAAIILMIGSFLIVLLPILWFSYLFISKITFIFSESSF